MCIGQDGAYLRACSSAGYEFMARRGCELVSFSGLARLGIRDRLQRFDGRERLPQRPQVLVKVQPDEIYNLSGQSPWGCRSSSPSRRSRASASER